MFSRVAGREREGGGVIHYHGTPITPRKYLHELAGRHFCVSYAAPGDLAWCLDHAQSIMLDSGAFSAWTRGHTVDWDAYMDWCEPVLDAHCHWAVIPDVIDGDEAANDMLLVKWFMRRLPRGAPVWHMHESIDRLKRLCAGYERVCIGSSAEYRSPGTAKWHRRMEEAMNAACGNGPAPTWLHMLRAAKEANEGTYPFASCDSTNLARNHAGNNQGTPRKDVRRMADLIDSAQTTPRWRVRGEHLTLEAA
jgi:hypothetical protein